MEYLRLSDCSDYSSERTSNITFENYISTENMLPNKGGVTVASSLPDVKSTSAYKKDDILLSNIRPYFCKIWLADKEGSCSNDVLVVRAKKGFDSKFLYYVLSDKNFFNWDTVTSKGTKMPRGTPKAIMKYFVPNVDLPTQQKIAGILSKYDEAIENNNKRIKLLEQMAQNLYKEWFVRFRFPGWQRAEFENGIPKEWKVDSVKNVFEIFDTDRIPLSSIERDSMRKIYPYYGAAELMDYVENYIFDGIYLLMGEDGSVITPSGKPMLQYVWGKFWVNNHAHILQGKKPFTTEFIYLMFKNMDITGIVTGSAQPKISQGRLFKKKTIIPPTEIIMQFNKFIEPMFGEIRCFKEQTQNLSRQRDLLLPRLMSGKLQVFRK